MASISFMDSYALKWNNHPSTVLTTFKSLLLNEKHTDCTLVAGGKKIKAHRVIISACSPYLEHLLDEYSDEKSCHPILIFSDMDFDELEALVEYMYKGETHIAHAKLNSFVRIAKNMKVKGLSDQGGGLEGPRSVKPNTKTVGKRKRASSEHDSDSGKLPVATLTPRKTRGTVSPITSNTVVKLKPETSIVKVVPKSQNHVEPTSKKEPVDDIMDDLSPELHDVDDPNDLNFSLSPPYDAFDDLPPSGSNDIDFDDWKDEETNFEHLLNDPDLEGKLKYKLNAKTQMYECVQCPKAYKQLQVLYRHIQFECTAIDRTPCPFVPCKYNTLKKISLLRHITNIHKDL